MGESESEDGCTVLFTLLCWLLVAVVSAIRWFAPLLVSFGPLKDFYKLSRDGVGALGIILQIDPLPIPKPPGTREEGPKVIRDLPKSYGRVELRNALVDVEIPGRSPFTARTRMIIPANMVGDVLPGAMVELRLYSHRNHTQMAVVGPGSGFAGLRPIPIAYTQS